MSFCDVIKKYSANLNDYGTDKITSHSYGQLYDKIFGDLKARNLEAPSVLEIGIYSGAFLQAISDYLPSAMVYGIDIRLDRVRFGKENPHIKMFEMDGTKNETATSLDTSFDIIIEDGSHIPEHQVMSLDAFAPYLNEGGVYVIEDIAGGAADYLKAQLQNVADKHGLQMEWLDLRNVKGQFDDILAVFTKN